MIISRDFEDLFELLNSEKVRYLVVGGDALAFHGAPRYTGDIDIFVGRTPRNAARVLKVIEKFGFAGVSLEVQDFVMPDRILQLGYPPWRIDILTGLTGIHFDKAWKSRVRGRYGKAAVWYISKSDLIRNKRSTGRTKDLADIEALGVSLKKRGTSKKKSKP